VSSPMYTPETDRELVVVYPTEEQARAAAQRVVELGVPAAGVRVGVETDEIVALRAEMREELSQAWIVPAAGFAATKEGMKGTLYLGTIATLIALVIAVPLAFVDYGATLGVRLLVHVVIALFFGGLVGFIAGGARNAKAPNELMAAQRGTVLRVDRDTPAIREALAALEPIRIDEVGRDDTPLDTVVTEDERDDSGVAQDMPANLRGDGYHPVDRPDRDADTKPSRPPGLEEPGG
jgi:hypothetical protein